MRLALAVLALGLASAAADAAPGDALYVQENNVALRAAPDPGAPVVLRLNRGSELTERGRRDGWIEVEPRNLRSVGGDPWVQEAHVGPVSPLPPEPPPEPAAAPAAPLPEQGPAGWFLLVVDGSPALAFAVTCRAVSGDGRQVRHAAEGLVPDRFAIEAESVTCRVRKQDARGRLQVALLLDDIVIAAAETAQLFGGVRLRSDGPWGEARARVDAVRLPLVRRFKPHPAPETTVPPFSGGPVPPFTSNPVPPLLPPS